MARWPGPVWPSSPGPVLVARWPGPGPGPGPGAVVWSAGPGLTALWQNCCQDHTHQATLVGKIGGKSLRIQGIFRQHTLRRYSAPSCRYVEAASSFHISAKCEPLRWMLTHTLWSIPLHNVFCLLLLETECHTHTHTRAHACEILEYRYIHICISSYKQYGNKSYAKYTRDHIHIHLHRLQLMPTSRSRNVLVVSPRNAVSRVCILF